MLLQRIDNLPDAWHDAVMPKTSQLQIRIDADQKERIRQRAQNAGMDVSKWVLRQLLPPAGERFQTLCKELAEKPSLRAYALAELHDFFKRLEPQEFARAVQYPPAAQLAPFEANYLAAMIEYTAAARNVPVPGWVKNIEHLETPWFASSLQGLRLYLLTHSPPAFRRRNLFIDSSVGERI